MIGAIFFFTSAKQFQRPRCLRMRASNQNRANQAHRSNVGTTKRGTGDRSDATGIANACDGRCFAVSDAEGRHAELFGAKSGLHRIAQTLPKTDSDEQILPTEAPDTSLHISRTANRSLGIKSECHQPVAQMPTQTGSQINS